METLRQGDILQGYLKISPKINGPINKTNYLDFQYELNCEFPKFSVIITQCCSIKDQMICMAPLKKINSFLVNNPELIENPVPLNSPIKKIKIYHPKSLLKMPTSYHEKIIAEDEVLHHISLFFFEGHDELPQYSVYIKEFAETHNTSAYYVDFREISHFKCPNIEKDHFSADILKSKVLELTIDGRNAFRSKLHEFFCRTPKEDLI
ncbi:hypothetical protein [Candidatus Lokiarchaeum ossiferum]|uniref:hypothetical protein n=1 Tax=Candidatus Lokiarchaeum ossiferum TaxID=2951803 RepID=UPI00352ED656